jgi:hypothetical protein
MEDTQEEKVVRFIIAVELIGADYLDYQRLTDFFNQITVRDRIKDNRGLIYELQTGVYCYLSERNVNEVFEICKPIVEMVGMEYKMIVSHTKYSSWHGLKTVSPTVY